MNNCPKLPFPESLFSRIYTCQNVHLAEITFPRKLIFQNLHLSECTFGRNYISPKAFFQNLHLPECTFGRNYISRKAYFPEFTLARMYIWPKLQFPESLFSKYDTHLTENSLLIEFTLQKYIICLFIFKNYYAARRIKGTKESSLSRLVTNFDKQR